MATENEGRITADAADSGIISITANLFTIVQIRGLIDVTNAGTLDLQWNQNTANPTGTTLQKGSWLRAIAI